MVSLESRVTSALLKILSLRFQNQEVSIGEEFCSYSQCHILSYQEHFSLCWQSWEKIRDWVSTPSTSQKNLILLWDGVPTIDKTASSNIRVEDYLTPLDWSVAFSLHLYESNANSIPNLRILIWDMQMDRYSHTHSVRFFRMFNKLVVPAMKWIRVFRTNEKETYWQLSHLWLNCTREEEHESFNGLAPTMRSHLKPGLCEGELLQLKRFWSVNLTDPSVAGDHHAISNLVGPILLGVDNLGQQDVFVTALHSLLTWLGLLPKSMSAGQGANPQIDLDSTPYVETLKQINKLDGGPEPLRILLLDDHSSKLGWGVWLRHMLQLDSPSNFNPDIEYKEPVLIGEKKGKFQHDVELYACESAMDFWENVRQCNHIGEKQNDQKNRYNFKVSIGNKEVPIDILLLDLRLFANKKFHEEVEFYKGLSSYIEERIKRDNRFSLDAFTQANKWLEAVSNEQELNEECTEYFETITWLARILSSIDFSLPIMLFSSTKKREIIQPLLPFRNIITLFDKPTYHHVISPSIREVTYEKLSEALIQALQMAYARRFCSFLKILSDGSDKKPINKSNDEEPNFTEKVACTTELLLDETGALTDKKGILTVGGLLVIYPPEVSPQEIEDEIYKKIKSEVSKSKNLKLTTLVQRSGGFKYKNVFRDNKDRITQIVSDVCESHEVKVSFVCLSGKLESLQGMDFGEIGEIENERLSDNLFRSLLQHIIETACYWFAGKLIPKRMPRRLLVRGASRTLPAKNNNYSDDSNELWVRWGIPVIDVGVYGKLWEAYQRLKEYSRSPTHKTTLDQNKKQELEEIDKDFSSFMNDASLKRKRRRMVRHFPFDGVRPIVEQIGRKYQGVKDAPVVDIAKAYGLNRANNRELSCLHLLTDAICRDAYVLSTNLYKNGCTLRNTSKHGYQLKEDELKALQKVLIDWCQAGFTGEYGDGVMLKGLLQAYLSYTHGSFGETIVKLHHLGTSECVITKKLREDKLLELLLQEVSQSSMLMNEETFFFIIDSLCERVIPIQPQQGTHRVHTIWLRGQYITKEDKPPYVDYNGIRFLIGENVDFVEGTPSQNDWVYFQGSFGKDHKINNYEALEIRRTKP